MLPGAGSEGEGGGGIYPPGIYRAVECERCFRDGQYDCHYKGVRGEPESDTDRGQHLGEGSEHARECFLAGIEIRLSQSH